jgi:hypothetical protein
VCADYAAACEARDVKDILLPALDQARKEEMKATTRNGAEYAGVSPASTLSPIKFVARLLRLAEQMLISHTHGKENDESGSLRAIHPYIRDGYIAHL